MARLRSIFKASASCIAAAAIVLGGVVALALPWMASAASCEQGQARTIKEASAMPVDQSEQAMLGMAVEPRSRIQLDLRRNAVGEATIGDLWDRPLAVAGRTVSLRLDDVLVEGRASGFRLFLNMPSANSETPVEDEHYVGSYAFFPLPEGKAGGEAVGSFIIPLTDALLKQRILNNAAPPDQLYVTLIPLGGAEVMLGFGHASLRID